MADIQVIKDRLAKYEADIQKRMERLQKLEQRESKLVDKIRATGVEVLPYEKFVRSRWSKKPNSMGHYNYDSFPDIDIIDRDIFINADTTLRTMVHDVIYNIRDQISCWNKIFEIEDKITTTKEKLQSAQEKQDALTDIPPILQELQKEMENDLTRRYLEVWHAAQETRKRRIANPKFREEIMREFNVMYGASAYEYNLSRDEEDVIKDAKRDAEYYVLDLLRRVTKKVGEIVDYRDLEVVGPAINGIVIGTNGSTRLETIVAGGYNIQRKHYRVILH